MAYALLFNEAWRTPLTKQFAPSVGGCWRRLFGAHGVDC